MLKCIAWACSTFVSICIYLPAISNQSLNLYQSDQTGSLYPKFLPFWWSVHLLTQPLRHSTWVRRADRMPEGSRWDIAYHSASYVKLESPIYHEFTDAIIALRYTFVNTLHYSHGYISRWLWIALSLKSLHNDVLNVTSHPKLFQAFHISSSHYCVICSCKE